jgi:hypothetical protein
MGRQGQSVRSASTQGSAPLPKQRSAVRARGLAPGDTPPLVGADRSSALRLEGKARDACRLRNHHRPCGQRARPIPPLEGMLRRVENLGDTGGSVEAFVEAWVVFRESKWFKSLICSERHRWRNSKQTAVVHRLFVPGAQGTKFFKAAAVRIALRQLPP